MLLCYHTEGKKFFYMTLIEIHQVSNPAYIFSYGLSEGKPTEKGLKIDAQVRKKKKKQINFEWGLII